MIKTPYLRSRNIDGGAVALIAAAGAFRVNVWNRSDDTFQDIETAEHDGTPEGRLGALRIAREFYCSIIDSQVSVQDLVAELATT